MLTNHFYIIYFLYFRYFLVFCSDLFLYNSNKTFLLEKEAKGLWKDQSVWKHSWQTMWKSCHGKSFGITPPFELTFSFRRMTLNISEIKKLF